MGANYITNAIVVQPFLTAVVGNGIIRGVFQPNGGDPVSTGYVEIRSRVEDVGWPR